MFLKTPKEVYMPEKEHLTKQIFRNPRAHPARTFAKLSFACKPRHQVSLPYLLQQLCLGGLKADLQRAIVGHE